MSKYVINKYPGDMSGKEWYVQEINYLDMGRFTTEEAAKEHLHFLEHLYDSSD